MLYQNKDLKTKFQELIKLEVGSILKPLCLNIVLVGDDLASVKYTNLKQNVGKLLGIEVVIHKYDFTTNVDKYQTLLDKIAKNHSGLIFQLPVPENIRHFVNITPENSDVDLLGVDSEKLWQRGFLPPTIGAIDLILKNILEPEKNIQDLIDSQINLNGKLVAVIGQGVLVGKPVIRYLLASGATIVSINKDTKNPKELTKNSDILICAAGSPNLVDKTWVNPNTIIIDAATSESSGVLVGDVTKDSLFETNLLVASPSGVGGLTVLYLFYNLLKLGS